jgi:uncharacterized membrane protein YvbJ
MQDKNPQVVFKMNKKLIWTITIAVLVILFIFLIVNNSDKTPSEEEGGDLPDTDKVQYNALATSSDDFQALEEAVNQLG